MSREQLILSYAPLVKSIARKMISKRARATWDNDYEDFCSYGWLGVMTCVNVDGFEDFPDDKKFMWMCRLIWNQVGDGFLELNYGLKFRDRRDRSRKYSEAHALARKKLGPEATDKEMAKELGTSLIGYRRQLDAIDYGGNFIRAALAPSVEDVLLDERIAKENPFKDLADSQEKERIRWLVDQLGEKDRTTIVMYYYEDKDLLEIAKALQVGHSTARARLSRARDQLRLALGLSG